MTELSPVPIAAVAASKGRGLVYFLQALGIGDVGEGTSKRLARAFGGFDAILAATEEQLLAVPDIGPTTAASILGAFTDPHFGAEIRLLAQLVAPANAAQQAEGPLSGKAVAVTGTLPSLSRDEAKGIIESLGGKAVDSVSKKTFAVLAGEAAGSKLAKAQALGIPVYDEAWLLGLDAGTDQAEKIRPEAIEAERIRSALATTPRPTWESRVEVSPSDNIFAALSAAGLPAGADGEIVCVLSVCQLPAALVACPNGLVYRFEPAVFEEDFWRFAVSNYYLVTGSPADRQKIAEMAKVDIGDIKGKSLRRAKGEGVSEMTLDTLLEQLGVTASIAKETSAQGSLF